MSVMHGQIQVVVVRPILITARDSLVRCELQ